MKMLILLASLLGLLVHSAFANINEENQGDVGGIQSLTTDTEKQVVRVHNNNGVNSWTSILDYKMGFMAIRIFSQKFCVVTKMNRHVMPDWATQTIREKQKDTPNKELIYKVNPKKITNLAPAGKHIVALCRGIPTYAAYEVPGVGVSQPPSGESSSTRTRRQLAENRLPGQAPVMCSILPNFSCWRCSSTQDDDCRPTEQTGKAESIVPEIKKPIFFRWNQFPFL